jgi:hypothetical protein
MLCHSKPSPFSKAEFLVLTDSFASLIYRLCENNFLSFDLGYFSWGGFADFFGKNVCCCGTLTEPLSQGRLKFKFCKSRNMGVD